MADQAKEETIGRFVDLLFERVFFTPNSVPLAISTYQSDVAADAEIEINGKKMSAAEFLESIKKFHAGSIAKLLTVEDLAVASFDPAGRSGVVAQVSKFTLTSRADGSTGPEQVSATIVKVEERDGRRVMTSLVEVQT